MTGRRSYFVFGFAAAIAGLVASVMVFVPGTSESDSLPAQQPGTSPTQTASQAAFVGSQTCRQCHGDQHQSYLLTAHSRALTKVNPTLEPADGQFSHEASGRTYSVFRRNDQLWHSEASLTNAAPAIEPSAAEPGPVPYHTEFPLRFLVGSGRHSRSYLVERDGFLMESPVTWYTSTGKWAMSPGYDRADHQGFERPIDMGCLICHAGQIEPVDQSFSRLQIIEESIGCERCHGPGSEHSAKHRKPEVSVPTVTLSGAPDPTIVNPSRLSRDRQESLCAQCHLRGEATVFHKGMTASDFRPGQLLSETRIDYLLSNGSGSMKVVGHMDQMHASACWQKSDSLTCATCHDSHASTLPSLAAGDYRQSCLQCHKEQACSAPVEKRQSTSVPDNCVVCHMPQVPTDIPHIAFTHHRIGRHNATEPQKNSEPESTTANAQLVPFSDVTTLSEKERLRSMALACVEFAYRAETKKLSQHFREEAKQRLITLVREAPQDGDLSSALARMAWEESDLQSAKSLAERACRDTTMSVSSRMNALFVAGDCLVQERQFDAAISYLSELTRKRHHSEDWLLLGLAQFQSGKQNEGLASAERALTIQPFRPELHETLAKMYAAAGNQEKSRRHMEAFKAYSK